ncbi:MAG: LptA/OstA family protein [Novosphingobium sp.]
MNRRSLPSLALRSLIGGAIAGSIIALAAGGFVAQGQGIAGFNSNAPVSYAADRIELQDKQDRVILAGNVDITQGDLRVKAARTLVAYSNVGSLKIQRIDATGGVVVSRGSETARGDVAIYDFNARVITMTGNVHLDRGGDTLNGGRIVIDLSSGVASVDGRRSGSSSAVGGQGSRGGRVSGTFSVPKKN